MNSGSSGIVIFPTITPFPSDLTLTKTVDYTQYRRLKHVSHLHLHQCHRQYRTVWQKYLSLVWVPDIPVHNSYTIPLQSELGNTTTGENRKSLVYLQLEFKHTSFQPIRGDL